MKLFKSLLLGSAVGVSAAATAQAADLPSRKAAPAEYVKICDAYGAGFFYIPGTDTCLKVGGYVRAEYLYMQPLTGFGVTTPATSGLGPATTGKLYNPAAIQDTTGFMMRGRVELDARTQTPWGTARTFIGVRGQNSSGPYAGSDTTYAAAPAGGLGVAYTGKAAGAGITLENAVIQFAGFTFGHTTADVLSFLPPEYYMPFFSFGSPAGYNVLAYTAVFGGGFSGTIGIEDKQSMGWNQPGSPTVIGGGAVTTALGPYTWPTLVANVRYDQSWGSAQISGGLIDNTVLVNGPASGAFPATSFVKESVGWGITGGLKINLPMLGPGDHIYLNASYGDGFLDIVGGSNSSISAGDDGRLFGGLLRMDSNAWTRLGKGCAVGTALSGCYSLQNTTAWSVDAFFDHFWSPTLRTVLMLGYEDILPPGFIRNTDWSSGGLSEVQIFRVSLQPLVWNPVPGLEIGGEVSYGNLSQSLAHAPGFTSSPLPAGYPSPSSSQWQGRLRATRQF